MSAREAFVHRLPARGPDDVSALANAIAAGTIRAECIVAIFGKTEGNGCVNDFSRGFAARALADEIARHAGRAAADAVCLVMSGGTEGAMSPHFTVFEVRESNAAPTGGALAIGHAHTPSLPASDLGRTAQIESVADGVRLAMKAAGIDDPHDVFFVQVKCPLLTHERIAAAERDGRAVATRDTLKSMGLSRGASALGCALALGEVTRGQLSDEVICADWTLWSERASASAGIELQGHEIVVLGRGANWAGPLRIDGAFMRDGIDIEPVREALARLGLASPGQLRPSQQARVRALLSKAEAGSTGFLRGNRHTMLDDSDISPTRHARGFVAGALASLIGRTDIYVSGGAEHQGPDGGGPVAIIASANEQELTA